MARYRRVVATHAYEPFSANDDRAENAVHVNLCLCYDFPKANFSSEEWCYANDVSYGIIALFSKTSSRLKSGACFEVGSGGEGGTALFGLYRSGMCC